MEHVSPYAAAATYARRLAGPLNMRLLAACACRRIVMSAALQPRLTAALEGYLLALPRTMTGL